MRKVICVVSAITILCGVIVYFCNGCCWASVFNSSFGMLNALFSGLAFAGVISTLIWQKSDSDKKSFESNLYKQIEFFLQLVENLSYKNKDGADPYEGKGREIFEWFYESKRYFIDGRNDIYGMKIQLQKNLGYFSIDKDTNVFESYFYYLFNLYEYIDHSKLDIDREAYANQITALLTKYELLLLFYYVLGAQENLPRQMKMLAIIYKYHIFKNLNKDDLANQNDINKLDTKAFE